MSSRPDEQDRIMALSEAEAEAELDLLLEMGQEAPREEHV